MDNTSAFNIRVPEPLKQQLVARAKENGRSLNMEIVQILKTAEPVAIEPEADAPGPKKRGRPKKEKTMTKAEMQARWRAKKKLAQQTKQQVAA
ncbi:Arc family DNA-binding protein [Rhizobium deserti]|uniref:Arc family DNA-binding protein n=1 Tax=Rhizobium deserti TaxID=2547961 RepID=A0A4R5UJQ8_9HYPH|nr:Arc family DNA-binding protein [Rhizobium deserti]TDK37024.1 Arc family DNA-binding protein [Rhizobium deserti]